MKKKKPTLFDSTGISFYNSKNPLFGFCKKEGSDFRVMITPDTCRETTTANFLVQARNEYRDFMIEKKGETDAPEIAYPHAPIKFIGIGGRIHLIYTKSSRAEKVNEAGVTKSKEGKIFKDSIKKGLQLLHVVEKEVGFNMAKVVKVIHDNPKFLETQARVKAEVNTYVFSLDRRWFKSTYSMSICMLLIRLCLQEINPAGKITNVKELGAFAEKHYSASTCSDPDEAHPKSCDGMYVKNTTDIWIPFLKNINELYPKSVRKELYFTYQYATRCSEEEGIAELSYNGMTGMDGCDEIAVKLCQFPCENPGKYCNKLQKKFSNILDKA